jgi:protein-tyrosine phosphatase
MADFSFVNPSLAVGAAINTPSDLDQILDAGITAIIDCQIERDDSSLLTGRTTNAGQPIAYLWDPTADDGQPKPTSWFAAGINFAAKQLATPGSPAILLVHCAAGVNRSPSLAFAILRSQGLSPAAAELAIRTARPQVGLAYKADADRAIAILGYDHAL